MTSGPIESGVGNLLPTYVFDTSAILRYLDREAGGDRVRAILDQCADRKCRTLISAVNWGELATKLYCKHGPDVQTATMASLLALRIEIIPATAERAVKSGLIKGRLAIPCADAFGIELTGDSPSHVLITADFDAKPAASEIRIEFLSVK
jgi:PIN domain nuclease of toxin-antitoxin system